MHAIAAKAVALKIAAGEEFKDRQQRTLSGAKILAERLSQADVAGKGISVLTGGTDVHLVLVDLRNSQLDGQQGEDALHEVGITVNRNAVPFDPRPPMVTSGLRIGTPRARDPRFRRRAVHRGRGDHRPDPHRGRRCRRPARSREQAGSGRAAVRGPRELVAHLAVRPR